MVTVAFKLAFIFGQILLICPIFRPFLGFYIFLTVCPLSAPFGPFLSTQASAMSTHWVSSFIFWKFSVLDVFFSFKFSFFVETVHVHFVFHFLHFLSHHRHSHFEVSICWPDCLAHLHTCSCHCFVSLAQPSFALLLPDWGILSSGWASWGGGKHGRTLHGSPVLWQGQKWQLGLLRAPVLLGQICFYFAWVPGHCPPS